MASISEVAMANSSQDQQKRSANSQRATGSSSSSSSSGEQKLPKWFKVGRYQYFYDPAYLIETAVLVK